MSPPEQGVTHVTGIHLLHFGGIAPAMPCNFMDFNVVTSASADIVVASQIVVTLSVGDRLVTET